MKHQIFLPTVSRVLNSVLERYPRLMAIVKNIADHNGRALLVGGAVRDVLWNLPIKDLDIEVYGIALPELEQILAQYGPVSVVGKSFGVMRIHYLDVDWSVPRRDSSGRKPVVELDPFMSFQDAFARRDLTINAMGIDLMTHELIDPFNGKSDLEDGVLRSPDSSFFAQDPLRFYRVMQFIGRFECYPDAQLQQLCATIDVSAVSVERIEQEFEKLLMRSQRPSRGLRWLKDIGRLQELLPELAATVGVAQNPQWHPEGDVFEHTMQAVDAAAVLDYTSPQEKRMVMYAALCHDLGKAEDSRVVDGKIISWGHEVASAELAQRLLSRIMRNTELSDAVIKLVRHHMASLQLVADHAGAAAYKRLARKIAPHATIATLAKLAVADKRGRNPHGPEPLTHACDEVDEFLLQAERAGVALMPEEPLLHGRDFLDVAAPGPELGELVKLAYELQIELGINDKDELRKRVLAHRIIKK